MVTQTGKQRMQTARIIFGFVYENYKIWFIILMKRVILLIKIPGEFEAILK